MPLPHCDHHHHYAWFVSMSSQANVTSQEMVRMVAVRGPWEAGSRAEEKASSAAGEVQISGGGAQRHQHRDAAGQVCSAGRHIRPELEASPGNYIKRGSRGLATRQSIKRGSRICRGLATWQSVKRGAGDWPPGNQTENKIMCQTSCQNKTWMKGNQACYNNIEAPLCHTTRHLPTTCATVGSKSFGATP